MSLDRKLAEEIMAAVLAELQAADFVNYPSKIQNSIGFLAKLARTLWAENGDAALALLEAGEAVELIVTDLTMPGINGVALIHAAQQRNQRLPAILLTGYAGDTANLTIGQRISGPVILLRKPISGSQLADHAALMLEAASRF